MWASSPTSVPRSGGTRPFAASTTVWHALESLKASSTGTKHHQEDEFFYVVEGRLLLDLEGRTVELAPRQGILVPRGVLHRTRAPTRTVVLMVEAATVVPTGDVR